MGPTTISYLPHSRLTHGVGVGLPPTLYFFPRLPSSSLPHGVGVGSPLLLPETPWLEPPSWRRHWLASPSSRDSLARASLMALALARFSFFPRLPGSSLPHGVGVGSPLLLPETPWLEPLSWHQHWLASPSSRDSLARTSLMASALARLSFFPRLPSSSLPHGVGVGSLLLLPETPWLEPPSWRRRWLASPSSRDSLARTSLMASALARLSFFPRLPGSSLPHGISIGSSPSLSLFWRFPRKSSSM